MDLASLELNRHVLSWRLLEVSSGKCNSKTKLHEYRCLFPIHLSLSRQLTAIPLHVTESGDRVLWNITLLKAEIGCSGTSRHCKRDVSEHPISAFTDVGDYAVISINVWRPALSCGGTAHADGVQYDWHVILLCNTSTIRNSISTGPNDIRARMPCNRTSLPCVRRQQSDDSFRVIGDGWTCQMTLSDRWISLAWLVSKVSTDLARLHMEEKNWNGIKIRR